MKKKPQTTLSHSVRVLPAVLSSAKMFMKRGHRQRGASALRLLLPLVLTMMTVLPATVSAQDFKNAHFLRDEEVAINAPFSPFGNSLEVSKFGDDGSSAISDLSGVIVWIDANGEARALPNTEQAAPLYVTNSEVLVWTNKFADFDAYPERPDAAVSLYRLNTAGEVVSVPLELRGKEILDTPQITTSTGSFTLLTTERLEGPRERDGAGLLVDFSDTLTLRSYRVAFSGEVQRIGTYNDLTPFDQEDFANTQIGPDAETLGYGSDGSVFIRYKTTIDGFNLIGPALGTSADIFLWVNSSGVSRALSAVEFDLGLGAFTVTGLTEVRRTVFVSNTRLVLEETAGAGLSDFRRDAFNDQLTGPTNIPVAGSVLPFPNYTKIGDDKFFYTVEQLAGSGSPINGQGQFFYNGSGDNGTFNPGTGYNTGDAITLSDGSIVTVNGTSLVIPVNGQSHLDYDGVAPNGSFTGGGGVGLEYAPGDQITLTDGSVVSVNIIGVAGDVVEFTVDSSASTGAASGATLTQAATTSPTGVGFSLTLDANNVGGGEVSAFVIDSSASTGVAAGDTLTQSAVVPAGGTGFTLTIGANNLSIASTINTFILADGAANLQRSTGSPVFLSNNAQVTKINPADGSAILSDEDQSGLIWLHATGDNFVLIPDSQQASPLFVTADECLLWANAKAPIPEGGVPDPLLVVHEELTAGGTDTITTPINEAPAPGSIGNIEGTYVINTSPFTPSTAFWLLNTAEKTAPNKALIRTYRILDTPPDLDSDSDGLLDSVETNTGTFVDASDTGTDPFNPDSDGDGLSDRSETGDGIFVSTTQTGTDPNTPDTDLDGLLDFAETNTGIFVFYNFSDPTDPRNDTGTDPNVLNDTDGDLDPDGTDPDIDGDGTLNEDDAFPFDPTEDTDTDGDGIGNNADPDDDNDGVLDGDDAFPLDPDKSQYSLTLSNSQQASSFLAQSREVFVTTDLTQDWVWESDSSWITAEGEFASQTGSQTFTYDLALNTTGEERVGNITFKLAAGGATVTLEVTQLGGNVGGFFVTLSDSQQASGGNATERTVAVSSNTEWTWYVAETNSDWLSSGEDLVQNGDNLTFTYQLAEYDNPAASPRTATLIFESLSGGIIATLQVIQGNRLDQYLVLGDNTQAASFSAQDVSVNVFSDTDWRWESDSDWLTSAESLDQNGDRVDDGLGNTPFTYQVSVNDTGASRTGNLTFKTAAGDITAVLQVTQLSGNNVSLSLSDTQQANAFNVLTRDVTVFSNTTVLWESDQDWLGSAEDVALTPDPSGQQAFTYTMTQNNTGEARSGVLTFRTTSGGLIASLEVTQLGAFQPFILAEVPIVFADEEGEGLSLPIRSNTTWTWVSSDPSWLTSGEPLTQTGNRTEANGFRVFAEPNTTGEERIATITFTTDTNDPPAIVTVIQGGQLRLSQTQQATSFLGGSRDIEVLAGTSTTWLWESNAEWLTSSEALTQTGSQTYTYNFSPNQSGVARVGILTFTTADGGITRELEVTQLSGSTLSLDISVNEQVVISTANSYDIDVESNTEWTWSSDSDWITSDEPLTQIGAGPITYTYNVRANNTTEDRVGTITFFTTSGGISKTLTITQLRGDGLFLSLSNDKHANSSLAQPRSFEVFSNTDWTWVSSDPDWLISAEGLTQNGDQIFNYELAENATGETREGTFTFTSSSGGIIAVMEVTQFGGTGVNLSLSESERVTGAAANATLSVDVLSNTDWLWSSDSEWLTSAEPQEQNGNQTYGYEVAENDTGAQRTGTITFTSATGGLIAQLQVTQLSVPGSTLSLSETALATDFTAKTGLSVGVISDTTWVWESSDPSWLTAGTEALTQSGDQAFTYAVSENDSSATRVATLTFTSAANDIQVSLTVTQLSGTGLTLNLSETERVTGAAANAALTVDLSSNTDWLWSSDSEWLTSAEAQQQNGDQTFTYEVSANDTGAERSGTITFISATGGLVATLDVTQLSVPGSTLSLSQSTLVTDFNAKSGLTVDVTSDTTWVWQSSDATWLTASTEALTQTGNQTFTYEVASNTTGANRTATLTFTSEEGDVTAVLEVTQFSGSGLSLSLFETVQANSYLSQTREVEVFSNTDWIWETDSEWLQGFNEDATQTGDQTFTYKVTLNNTGVTRTGKLTFRSTSGGLIAELNVTQGNSTGDFLLLSANQRTTDFIAKSGTINVFSGTEWTWESTAPDWLTSEEALTQNENQEFVYAVSANTTGETRTGSLVFRSTTGDLIATLEVTQLSGSSTNLSISETQQTYSYEATDRFVEVTSNTEWTWRSDVDWITSAVVPTNTGPLTFNYSVSENTGADERVGTVTFVTTSGDITAILTITQLANSGEILALSETEHANSYEATPEAQPRQIQVFSNKSWLWESDADWIIVDSEPLEQTGDQTFEYRVAENLDAQERTGTITFITTTGNVTATLNVTQLAGLGLEGLSISPEEIATGPDAAGLSINVASNTDWQWTSSASWLTSTEDASQSGNQTFDFEISENTGLQARFATVVFTTADGATTRVLTVTQFATLDDDRDGLSNEEETKPYFLIEGQFTWEQARLDAKRLGGTLAVITSAQELADMQDVLDPLTDNVWIGASDAAVMGTFVWVSGDDLTGYDNWALNQPDSPFGVSGIALQPDFTWNDTNKYSILKGYVLELPETNPLNPNSLGDSRYLDGELWVDSDGDGLLGVTEASIGTDPRTPDTDRDGLTDGEEINPFEIVAGAFSWEQARADAEDEKGRLAVIESEDILVRVMTAVGGTERKVARPENPLWIGASDLTGFSGFEWVNDTPVVYTNWAENQPNSFFGAIAIELKTTFDWNDANITELKGYVLEREATGVLNPDSDSDGLSDGLEVNTYGTNPNNPDTDGDGLGDGAEIDAGTDPFNPDSDGDGLTDGEEVNTYDTDPLNPDSDGDGITDGDEVAGGSDPNDPNDPVDGGGGIDSGSGDPKRDPNFQTKIVSLLSTDEVKSDPFTPFGNQVRVVKFGDDGSQVVIDNSGILLWGRTSDDGFDYTLVEGSEQAQVIDVSNSELILWTNRYADFENYADRPEVQVALYRFNADGELTSSSVDIQGKEILDTPSITTTTASRIITTTERIEGPRELNTGNIEEEEFYDSLSVRVYRITATGEVQRLTTYSDVDIPFDGRDFADTQVGPGVEALGYGSDGSQIYQYKDFLPDIVKAPNPRPNRFIDDFAFSAFDGDGNDIPIYFNRVLWANGLGEADEVVLDTINDSDPDTTIERVVFITNSRLVLEVNREIRELITIVDEFGFLVTREEVTGTVREIRDYRRNNDGSGQISSPVIIPLTNAGESILDGGNLTIRGNIPYFYTTDGSSLRSYELTASGARKIGEVELAVGISEVAKINPQDGSAIIESEDTATPLIWVFPNAEEPADESLRFLEVESSGEASAMFVTSDELIIWDNAYAPIPFGTGVPNDAVIKHIVRSDPDPDGNAPNFLDLEVTTLVTEGIYVLNSPRAVLPTDLWSFITAEKLPDPGDTALIRTYKLDSAPDLDTDGDGLLDRYETNTGIYVDSQDTGTDPEVADTDGDGVTDGDEVYPYYVVNDSFAYTAAVSDAQKTSAIGNVYRHLAVINSKRELNEFQRRFGESLPANYWIGLDDLGVEDDFQWVETSPPDVEFTGIPGAPESFDFENWGPGQPNNLNGADAVVVNKDFTWDTQVTDNPLGYIVELQRTNPLVADTDGDGLSDGVEVNTTLTDPNNQDTDGDDGTVIEYIVDGQVLGTAILDGKDAVDPDPLDSSNPSFTDQDGDGLTDAVELLITNTLPDNPDSDGDGLSDLVETNTGNFVDSNNTGTDPNNSDSDGDGVNDGDELFNGTDPNVNDYESGLAVAAPAKGSFTGLLYREEDNEELGKITVTITKRSGGLSYFSGRIAGTNKYSSSSFKGKFDFGGKYSGQVYNSNGLLSIADMAFIQDTTGRLSLGGVLLSPDGTRETFSLVSNYYNDTWRKPTEFRNPSRYTYLAASPTTDSLAVPAGDAIGYGSISSKGKVIIKGWSNAGYKYTYKGYLQNGNQVGLPGNADFQAGNYGTIPFYTRTYGESSKKSTSKNEWMVGIIRYDMSGAVEAVDGRIRYVKPASNSRYYPAGFDQNIEMKGSKYSRTGFAAIPVNGFELFANNALGSFEGSLLDDSEFTPYVFTWNSKGYMKVPSNFTVYKKGRMRNKHGFFTSKLIDYVTGKRASIGGVVLQNRGVVSGHALNSSGVSVRHSISPNETGAVTPWAYIRPTYKHFENDLGKSIGGSYSVRIEISPNSLVQDWTVNIPADIDWVSADVLSGSGPGEITITVEENFSFFNRAAVIKIGGFNHRIEQDRRTAD